MENRHQDRPIKGHEKWLAPTPSGWCLAPGFLYRTSEQVALWETVHRVHAPLYLRDSVADLFTRGKHHWMQRMGKRPHHVIAWACGTGDKEVAFCKNWSIAPLSWTAVDISRDLVEISLERARGQLASVSLSGQVLDFSREEEPSPATEKSGPCLHLLFGVLANQPPQWILEKMAAWMSLGDVLVAGVNGLPADSDQQRAHIRQQYDNPETRSWLAEALNELDVDPDGVGWSWEWVRSDEGWGWQLVCQVEMSRGGVFRVDSESIPYSEGQKLVIFSTNRFLLENPEDWRPPSPLRLAEMIQSTCGEEALLFLEIQPDRGF